MSDATPDDSTGEAVKPLVEVDCEDNGGKVAFYSADDVNEWIERERSYWNWLLTIKGERYAEVRSRFTETLHSLDSHMKELKVAVSSKNSPDIQVISNRIHQVLNDNYRAKKVLHSSHPEAAFASIVQQQQSTARGTCVVSHVLGVAKTSDPEWLLAGIELTLFRRGIHPHTAEAHKTALDKVHSECLKLLQESKAEKEAFQQEFRKAIGSADEHLQKQRAACDKLVGDSKNRLDGIEVAYDEGRALSAPSRYWKDRQTFHSIRKWRYATAAIVTIAGGALLITLMLWSWLPVLSQTASQSGIDSTTILFRNIATIVLATTFLVWIARVIVRMYLSHAHLENDASERRVMTMMYLTLLRRKKLDEKDRPLILSQLFRHGATGIVNEDAAPAQLTDVTARLLAPK